MATRAGTRGLQRTVASAPGPPDRRITAGLVVGLGVLAFLIHPLLAPAVPAAVYGVPHLRERSLRRRRHAAVVDQLPDVVDLLRLTTLAGLPVSTALTAIDDLPGGPLGYGLHKAVRQLDHGAPVARALTVLGDDGGPPLRPLVEALVDHDRYGTPLGPALDRVGIEARLVRRRASEEAARRLPVTLLFPLVFTTLPACGLLTVIPLLVASLSSLQP
jgi:tight adherence protein C